MTFVIALQLLIPKETLLDGSVDFERLARHEMTGGNIKSAIFRAASRAALQPEEDRKLRWKTSKKLLRRRCGKPP